MALWCQVISFPAGTTISGKPYIFCSLNVGFENKLEGHNAILQLGTDPTRPRWVRVTECCGVAKQQHLYFEPCHMSSSGAPAVQWPPSGVNWKLNHLYRCLGGIWNYGKEPWRFVIQSVLVSDQSSHCETCQSQVAIKDALFFSAKDIAWFKQSCWRPVKYFQWVASV